MIRIKGFGGDGQDGSSADILVTRSIARLCTSLVIGQRNMAFDKVCIGLGKGDCIDDTIRLALLSDLFDVVSQEGGRFLEGS
jgi:hypothetical protein